MKIFGAGYNLSLFENHVLVILEEARLDYEKALPEVEVFLGEVFRQDALQAKPGEIFLPDADVYRREHGAKAGTMLAKVFLDLLARIVRELYLPESSPRWLELEKLLGKALDYNWYHLPGEDSAYCPAVGAAEGLFVAALLGQTHQELNTRLNYHSWRHWFYSLWGQQYEWGCINNNERTAEANGILYQYTMIQPRQLLEAHGFKVVVHPGKTVEYWR